MMTIKGFLRWVSVPSIILAISSSLAPLRAKTKPCTSTVAGVGVSPKRLATSHLRQKMSDKKKGMLTSAQKMTLDRLLEPQEFSLPAGSKRFPPVNVAAQRAIIRVFAGHPEDLESDRDNLSDDALDIANESLINCVVNAPFSNPNSYMPGSQEYLYHEFRYYIFRAVLAARGRERNIARAKSHLNRFAYERLDPDSDVVDILRSVPASDPLDEAGMHEMQTRFRYAFEHPALSWALSSYYYFQISLGGNNGKKSPLNYKIEKRNGFQFVYRAQAIENAMRKMIDFLHLPKEESAALNLAWRTAGVNDPGTIVEAAETFLKEELSVADRDFFADHLENLGLREGVGFFSEAYAKPITQRWYRYLKSQVEIDSDASQTLFNEPRSRELDFSLLQAARKFFKVPAKYPRAEEEEFWKKFQMNVGTPWRLGRTWIIQFQLKLPDLRLHFSMDENNIWTEESKQLIRDFDRFVTKEIATGRHGALRRTAISQSN